MSSLFAVMLPLFASIGVWEWVVIGLVILLLFGGKKIPELMRGLGKGMKSFKAGMKDAEKDIQEIKAEIVKDEDEKKPEQKETKKEE